MSEPTTDAPEDASTDKPEGAEKAAGTAQKKGVHARDPRRLLRIRVPVIAILAQKHMKLGEVLNLNVGSIIQLHKPADELLDLMVNDQRVGRGETVRIGENFGLQIVEMGSVQETIRKLGVTVDAEAPPEDAQTDEPQAGEPQAEKQA
ncbi:MAG TPA: FliM/FliN family flagellar motor C-terminal domain-containing protein [Planctomycetota bacterium]|nr:FliM/FliN family flagellar motor C-terminal domain-containing protein [Planctomycetota bacterium]